MSTRLEDRYDAATLAVLRTRTERLARPLDSHRDDGDVLQVALLQAGPEKVGVVAERMSAIVDAPPLTPLAGLPPWMPGIVQVRGEVLSVVDLARLLGLQTDGEPTTLAIVEDPRGPLGLLATRLLGFEDIYPEDLAEDFSGTGDGPQRPVGGVTRGMVSILDLGVLYDNPHLIIALGGSAREKQS